MSPRKLKEDVMIDVMISFVRSSRSQIFFKIDVLKNFANFIGKKPVLESLPNTVY